MCGLYLVRIASWRSRHNLDIIQELETDILPYKSYGEILILGDHNAHICDLPSIIQNTKMFKRKNKDTKKNVNGEEIITILNLTDIRILNSLNS